MIWHGLLRLLVGFLELWASPAVADLSFLCRKSEIFLQRLFCKLNRSSTFAGESAGCATGGCRGEKLKRTCALVDVDKRFGKR